MGAGPDAPSNMTVARFRSSQKLAVDAPDANPGVASETQVLAPRQEGIPGGMCGRGDYDARLLCRSLKAWQGLICLFRNFFPH